MGRESQTSNQSGQKLMQKLYECRGCGWHIDCRYLGKQKCSEKHKCKQGIQRHHIRMWIVANVPGGNVL